jgi:hypothetical protein
LLTLALGEGTRRSASRCHGKGIMSHLSFGNFPGVFFKMSRLQCRPLADQPLGEHSGVGVIEVSGRPNRYVVGSWLADKLMAVLWFYLVLRGVGRRRRSAPK